ncbi:MAG TPA: tripartite tricarboxylate transporter substrate binding protein [Burkholderiales bacterium]|nr:tripartite tricarboxylate transporter substrate binding protein [Burkholderiales bacterium]
MLLLKAAAFFTFVIASPVLAQTVPQYPAKPVRMIVTAAAGSGPDITARIVGQKLTAALGQSVVIENRPGAGGSIAAELAAKAAPDGYTLVMASAGSHAVSPALYPKLAWDPVRDFVPITIVAVAPNILIVHPSLPVKSVRELIALAKARPGELSFGSGGSGSTAHLSGELFRTMANIKIVHIPFKGAPSAALGVIGGQVEMALLNLPPTLPQVKSGRLKGLAVTTAKRTSAIPELPTIAEAGVPGYEASTWYGVMAPAGTPNEITGRLYTAIIADLRTDDTRARIAADGGEVVGSTPEEFAATLKRDLAKWTRVVKESGARAD